MWATAARHVAQSCGQSAAVRNLDTVTSTNRPLHIGHWVDGRMHTRPPSRMVPAPPGVADRLPGGVPVADTQDVDRFLAALSPALVRWLATPLADRRDALRRAALVMERIVDECVEVIVAETGAAAEGARAFVAYTAQRMRGISDEPEGLRYRAVAPGITALLISRQHSDEKVVPAAIARLLLNDCIVVLQPDPAHALLTHVIVEAFQTELPPGLVNLIHGDRETTDALITNPLIASVYVDGTAAEIEHAVQLGALYRKPVVRYAEDPVFAGTLFVEE